MTDNVKQKHLILLLVQAILLAEISALIPGHLSLCRPGRRFVLATTRTTARKPTATTVQSSKSPQNNYRYYDDDDDDDDDVNYYGNNRDSGDYYGYKERDRNKDESNYDGMTYNGDRNPNSERNTIERYYDDDAYDDEYEDYDDEYIYDDDDDNEVSGGNFWSNPKGGMDNYYKRPRQRSGSYERRVPDRASRQTRGRSSFRYGDKPPPAAARDFYNRLFWYGFDPDDADTVGDKTVFGGTKGKFNGLAYLTSSRDGSVDPTSQRSNRRQLPQSRQEYVSNGNDVDDRYYDENGDNLYYYDDDYEEGERGYYDRESRRGAPPVDSPLPFSGSDDETSRRAQRRRQRRNSRGYGGEAVRDGGSRRGDWASKQVSSWFTDSDEDINGYDNYDNYDDDDDRYSYDDIDDARDLRGRRRGNQNSGWSPLNMLDAFFGMNTEERERRAREYEALVRPNRSSRRSRRRAGGSSSGIGGDRSRRQRRKGYAYPYQKGNSRDDYDYGDEEYDPQSVVEIDTTAEAIDETEVATRVAGTNQEVNDKGPTGNDSANPGLKKKEKSWEERALEIEQVPPKDIPAWGPNGELPMDARTKAIMDALEDISEARQKLANKEKKEAVAREDITILKVDAELQRRRLEESRKNARLAQERLRQIELDIDDASRSLRRARSQVQIAREQLEELQERHWALLGYFDPDQASARISEVVKEFQLPDPSVRLPNDIAIPNETPVAAEQVDISREDTFESETKLRNPDDGQGE